MAMPRNDLDVCPVYTYHLALFMHHSQPALERDINNFNWQNIKTTNKFSSFQMPSCLLNSITDPFQSIQEFKIEQIAPNVSSGYRATPWGQFSIRIVEPGNCMFLTKIKELMDILDVKAFASAVWGVKIKFVGRLDSGEIVEFDEVDPIFGMLVDIRSNFTHMGSTYDLSFVTTDTMGVAQVPQHANSLQFGTMFEGISISGVVTLQDAFTKLQEKLQYNYDQEFQKQFSGTQIKKIKYILSIDDENIGSFPMDGTNVQGTQSAQKSYVWEKGTVIADAVTELVFKCPKIAKQVGDSKEAWKKPFHVDGKMYQILTSVTPKDSEVEVKCTLMIYNGVDAASIGKMTEGTTVQVGKTYHTLYDFEFYFSKDYNVDVINFDMSANIGLILYLTSAPNTSLSNRLQLDAKGTEDIVRNGNEAPSVIDQNTKCVKHPNWKEDKIKIENGKHDCLVMATQHPYLSQGRVSEGTDGDKIRTRALESLAKYSSIDNISKNLTIRGHYDILRRSLKRGDTMGSTQGIWVNLNIFSRDPDAPPGTEPDRYFYNAPYQALGITHSFSEGKFTQELTLLMMSFEHLKDLNT